MDIYNQEASLVQNQQPLYKLKKILRNIEKAISMEKLLNSKNNNFKETIS